MWTAASTHPATADTLYRRKIHQNEAASLNKLNKFANDTFNNVYTCYRGWTYWSESVRRMTLKLILHVELNNVSIVRIMTSFILAFNKLQTL